MIPKVQDRMVVKTVDHARKCTSPEGLQTEIDKLVSQTPRGRAFVRPSGTEDVVRVYAEAETQVRIHCYGNLVRLCC